jgi:NAD(P)-dependent dehydrogenase (short-subunit alcohol dehydrogenase family)
MGALDGKIAAVTGAGGGLGREIALMFADEGAKVVVNDLGCDTDGTGDSQTAEQVAEEIRKVGGDAVANLDSVAEVEGGQRIFQTAMDNYGALDILVNNAGILRDVTLFNMEEPQWDAVIAVHLKGHYCCTRPFARYIRETNRKNCRILNFSSVSGLFGNFGQSNYGAAKAGIAGFNRVVALELAKFGTGVNVISPGGATRMTIHLMEARGVSVDLDDPRQSPKQVAPVVTWLASDASDGITGEIIDIRHGLVSIMQQPKLIRSFDCGGLWSLEDLDKVMPQLMEAKKAHDEKVDAAAVPETI